MAAKWFNSLDTNSKYYTMEKELKAFKGVLLRADLTEHGQFSQSANFCQKGWDGHALLGQPSKGHPCRILILFPYCSTISLAPHIKKLETYFALFIFLDFCTVCPAQNSIFLYFIDWFCDICQEEFPKVLERINYCRHSMLRRELKKSTGTVPNNSFSFWSVFVHKCH